MMKFPPIVDNTHFTMRPLRNSKRARIIKRLIELGGLICHWCGGEVVRGSADGRMGNNVATIDHKQARALGGSDDLENCVLSCWKCNHDRGMADGFWISISKMRECAPNRLFGCRIKCGEAV